jgi:hypothetical protein
MNPLQRPLRNLASAAAGLLARPFGATARRTLRLPTHAAIVAALLALAGCATGDRPPEAIAAPPVAPQVWRQIDGELAAASLAAAEPAEAYARDAMAGWRLRIERRTESDFIAWFCSYWTQQWLAIKVAWYKLGSGDPAARRLAIYLQEQYRDRVLDPVAREIDPEVVRRQATTLYVTRLRERTDAIARRYAVPRDQFERRLGQIPAIALAPPTAHRASLYQLIHADPLTGLPAAAALFERIGQAAGGGLPADQKISPVAQRASERLLAQLVASGGASAAAAAVGGVAGVVISLGAAGFGAMAHEKQRPEMEAQLRASLDAALGELWHDLVEDPDRGVMAGVYHIDSQIAEYLAPAMGDDASAGPPDDPSGSGD